MYGKGKKLSKLKTLNIRNPSILNKKNKKLKTEKFDIFGHFSNRRGKTERKRLEKKILID